MKQIRNSVFETNSSSCHSIAINEATDEFFLDNTLLPDQDGVIELKGGEFGWEFCKYNDALTKANYCLVDRFNDENLINLLKEVIIEQTAADKVVILADLHNYESAYNSYIDHDSNGIATEAFASKEKLRNFIFNKNSWLFTANDNSTPDPTFYDVPLYKNGKVINPVYTHTLVIEGYKKTTLFKKYPDQVELEKAIDALLEDVKYYGNGLFDDDNSVMSQLTRIRGSYFEYKYDSKVTESTIEFLKDTYSDASAIYKRRFPKDDWSKDKGYEKVKAIEEELKKENPEKYVALVNYKIIEIKK